MDAEIVLLAVVASVTMVTLAMIVERAPLWGHSHIVTVNITGINSSIFELC